MVCLYRGSGWRMYYTLKLNGTQVDKQSITDLLKNLTETELSHVSNGTNIKVILVLLFLSV